MQQLESSLIKHIVNEYLAGLVLDVKLDEEKLQRRADKYRNDALKMIKSEIYQHCVRSIIDQCKDTIACKSQNDVEIAFNRGQIYGLKQLDDTLRNFTAGKSKDMEDLTDD